jgi:hypothetical protein
MLTADCREPATTNCSVLPAATEPSAWSVPSLKETSIAEVVEFVIETLKEAPGAALPTLTAREHAVARRITATSKAVVCLFIEALRSG